MIKWCSSLSGSGPTNAVQREEIRLEVQHDIIYRFFGETLFFPSIPNPRSILECGYGRGQWAVQVAEDYELCEVSRHGEERYIFCFFCSN